MKEILQNIALVDMLAYCKLQGLNCSGTRITKLPRKYKYALLKENGKPVCSVEYYKNKTPTYLAYTTQ